MEIDWDVVKRTLARGDVVLIHRETSPRHRRHRLLNAIHVFDGCYDHAVLVLSKRGSTVKVADTAPADGGAITAKPLDDVVRPRGRKGHRDYFEVTNVEVRRLRSPTKGTSDPSSIVKRARSVIGEGHSYDWPDLLLSAVAALHPSPPGAGDNALRTRIVALAVALLEAERREAVAGGKSLTPFTCADFVHWCYGGALAEAPTLAEVAKDFGPGASGAPARTLVTQFQREIEHNGAEAAVLSLLRTEVSVADEPSTVWPFERATNLGALLVGLVVEALRHLDFPIPFGALDADRRLIRVRDLHCDENLWTVCSWASESVPVCAGCGCQA